MAAYSWICIGEECLYPVSGHSREGYSTSHAALFRDEDFVGEGKYRTSAKIMRDRLQLLGHSSAKSSKVVHAKWSSRHNVQDKVDKDGEVKPEDLIRDYVQGLTDGTKNDVTLGPTAGERLISYWGYIWGEDEAQLRFLVDRLPDEHPIVFDLSGVIGTGHVEWSPTLCADARSEEAAESVKSMPLIVLTEGSTDAEILTRAMEKLRPDLLSFITFMDYSHKPEGGAGAVTNGLKAFSAAGVGNRVIGLYDNDTAGREAMKSVTGSGSMLRANIRPVTLPELEFAKKYPAYGPDGLSEIDINGRAVSIELFLGRDILMDHNRRLTPIQWTSYIRSMESYQGEITQKKILQGLFWDKVNSDTFTVSEWDDLNYLIDYLVANANR